MGNSVKKPRKTALRDKGLAAMLRDFNLKSENIKVKKTGKYIYFNTGHYSLLAIVEKGKFELNRNLRGIEGEISKLYSSFRHYLAKNRIAFEEWSPTGYISFT